MNMLRVNICKILLIKLIFRKLKLNSVKKRLIKKFAKFASIKKIQETSFSKLLTKNLLKNINKLKQNIKPTRILLFETIVSCWKILNKLIKLLKLEIIVQNALKIIQKLSINIVVIHYIAQIAGSNQMIKLFAKHAIAKSVM